MPVTVVALLKACLLAGRISAASIQALAKIDIAVLAARGRCPGRRHITGGDKSQPGDHNTENKEFPENLRYKYLFHFSSLLYGN
jgi:hypothetical protein